MSTLSITTVQADLVWEDKEANLRAFEEKIMAIREATELVVLPEMFSTGFSMNPAAHAEKMDGPTVGWMKRVAAEKKVVLTGSVIIEEDGHYFNRLIWMLPNGQFGAYDKRHRFAYAGEDEKYTPGHKRLIGSVKGWRVLLLVCYDLRFPVWSRQQADQGEAGPAAGGGQTGERASGGGLEYDLLLYVANWPDRRSHAWRTLLQARAIENQSYVVGVNRVGNDGNNIYHSGDSMVVDPLGEVIWQGSSQEGVFTHTLAKQRLEEVRSRFPFWRDADRFTIEP
jgi:omega-amidase